jgi:hypothetical protein
MSRRPFTDHIPAQTEGDGQPDGSTLRPRNPRRDGIVFEIIGDCVHIVVRIPIIEDDPVAAGVPGAKSRSVGLSVTPRSGSGRASYGATIPISTPALMDGEPAAVW